GVQIGAPVLFTGFDCPLTHTALADDPAQAKVADDLSLVGLLPNGSGRASGDALPVALLVLNDHRAAMVEHAALEVYAGRKLAAVVQILVNRVPASEQGARDGNFVADFERPDSLFRNGCGELDHKRIGVVE